MTDTPFERARTVLSENRYLVLSTVWGEGTWSAALAFTLESESSFFFASQSDSRHGRGISQNPNVSGVIFDSRASTEDVESIQFAGVAEGTRERAEVAKMLRLSASDDELSVEQLEEQVSSFLEDPAKTAYRVMVGEAWVLDQDAWVDRGVDAREPIVFAEVGAAVLRSGR